MKIIDSGMPAEQVWSGFFSPMLVLERMGLTRQHKKIVDLGCGYGTFAIPTAQRFSESVIYALDIKADMIQSLRQKTGREKLNNVVAAQRDFIALGTGFEDRSVDYVMLFNILHAENPTGILEEARRILKPGGMAGIIHWVHNKITPRGPALEIRPEPDQCKDWASAVGFSLIGETVPLPPYHYGIQIGA